MLQGSWYFYKSQSVDGPICAPGPNETRSVRTYDLQYAGFRIEFTQNQSSIDPDFGTPLYSLYYDGGSGTTEYSIMGYDQASVIMPFYGHDVQPNELYLSFPVMFTEGYGFEGGGKIVSLTNDELVIYMGGFPTLVYFKRSNQTNAPYNALGLSGDFVLDNYKEVNSGVVDVNESVPNGRTYSFNNEIYHEQSTKRVKYRGTQSGGAGSNYFLSFADAQPSGFTYEVSSTHLHSAYSSIWSSYKVILLNANELVLREGYSCNTYKEYHLTKVN
jgi:hypothetical protein